LGIGSGGQIDKCLAEDLHRHLRGYFAGLRSADTVRDGKNAAFVHFEE